MQVYPHSPGFKTPGTSETAARDIAPKAAIQREKIMAAYRKHGALTADEACDMAGVDRYRGGRSRVSELVASGWLIDTGNTRMNDSQKQATVWALAPEKVAA